MNFGFWYLGAVWLSFSMEFVRAKCNIVYLSFNSRLSFSHSAYLNFSKPNPLPVILH